MRPHHAWTAYQSTLSKQIGYSTPVSGFTEEECIEIQRKPIFALLPKLHLNRHFPRAVVFGPQSMGGMGIITVYSQQGLDHMTFCLGHIRCQDTTGKLVQIAINWEQLIAGTEHHILTRYGTKSHEYLEDSWAVVLMEFLNQAHAEIHINNAWKIKHSRQNDAHIMDVVTKNETTFTKEAINRCHIFL